MRIMLRLSRLVKPLSHVMLAAVLLGTAGYLCASFMVICGGFALLEVLDAGSGLGLKSLFIFISLFAVLRGVLRYGEQLSGHYIAFKLLAIIRDQVFQALRRLSPAKLEGRDKGDLISVITSDIELLEVFYAHTIAPVAIAMITSLFMTLFIGSYHTLLALIAVLAYVTVGWMIPSRLSKIGEESGMKYRNEWGNLNSYYLDSLRGLKEILQYGYGDKRLEEINRKTEELGVHQSILKSHEGISRGITDTAVLSLSLIMLLVCMYLFSLEKVGIEGVVIPTITLFSSFGPVIALSSLSNNLLQTIASGRRVLSILDEAPVIEEVIDGKNVSFRNMHCENISFSYDRETVLDNINVQIPQNKITGISGKSGSGKSTLLKLMMRFWDPDQGTIKISGHSLKDINTRSLRDMEGYVTQETCLFNDTIENNIKIARMDASPERVAEAAEKAAIHEFILSLPHGYQTNVGELGDKLSGGERQRIGLARAFLHDAPLILLDEPTSNLDSLNEAIILKSLKTQCSDKTVVLVSHRSSTMKIADTVYGIDRGRLA